MGKEVSIFTNQTNAPAKIGNRITALGEKLSMSGITNRRIQTNTNGTFKRLVNGEQIGKPMRGEINVIIVGLLAKPSRIYYQAKFDVDKAPTLPNCWSNLGDKPEQSVPDPQHKNCADCPQNVKGSGQGGGRACRYQRRISVLVEGDKSGEIYQINIPAKSLFAKGHGNVHGLESYFRFLRANDESPDTVVTNIAYDEDADQMELKFSPVRSINEAEYEQVIAAQSQPECDLYTKITVAQADGVTKEPPKAKQAEEDDDEIDEEPAIEEPAKKSKKKAETAEADDDDDLGDIINEWGGELDDD
jgi:hypothetical protein